MVVFRVDGRPVPQGSIRPIRSRSTGRVIGLHSSDALDPWRRKVGWAARVAGAKVRPGPVTLELTFEFARPASRPAPAQPTTRHTGDLDKLQRAVLDSLCGIAYKDDAQVVAVVATKRYADADGLIVCIMHEE